jgi:hypothetical protein
MKTYIEEFLMTFSGFHQTVFSFLTAYSLQQLFPQLTVHNNFFSQPQPNQTDPLSKSRLFRSAKLKAPLDLLLVAFQMEL